jgi:hypothetical protein
VKTQFSSKCRRRLFLAAAALAAISLRPLTLHASERWETLEAIHWIENPRNVERPGPRGELGAYQFRAETWRMYTRVPFSHANDRQASDQVAIRHYEWLKRGLQQAGMEITPYTIGLAWNAGLSAAVRGSAPSSARDYAQRVSNMAERLRRPLPTPAPVPASVNAVAVAATTQ